MVTGADVPVKVSVVVPVWNPGRDLDRCVASLLGQSLPRDEFEAIFVDDGSTDDTPARLDDLATTHANIRVIHIPGSGWPGKPRNVGVANATGEYVQFMDQDDHLAPQALERLYDYGHDNGADIVIGKVASDFRGVALNVFARDRASCTIHDAPLIDSLTPHKLFRRAFLETHGIAFPEGKRRLEDQLFMVQAYFAAASVAILAGDVCYFYYERTDKQNAGATLIVPDEYYRNLREVLDVVIANTMPGPERARLIRRFVRVEILARLSEPTYLVPGDDYRSTLFRAARAVLVDFMDAEVADTLGSVRRLRADLVIDDRPDQLLELARRVSRLRASCRVTSCRWERGKLIVGFEVGIRLEDGEGLRLVRRGDALFLDPAFTDGLSAQPIDVTDELSKMHVRVWIREQTTGVEWPAHARTEVVLRQGDTNPDGSIPVRPSMSGTVTLDAQRQALGRPVADGQWGAWMRLSGFGLDLRSRLGGEWKPAPRRALIPMLAEDPLRVVVPSLLLGARSGPGIDLSTDGSGGRAATESTSTDEGLGLRLDVAAIDRASVGRPIDVRSAADVDAPDTRLGTIRRDLGGRAYFEEIGVGRRTRSKRSARRYARAGWRRLPPQIQAPIRSLWGMVRRR